MDQRLDGWKSIASYFGRDRSTVSRWARERALPVHQFPGGKTKTVFAFEHELAAWSRRNLAALSDPAGSAEANSVDLSPEVEADAPERTEFPVEEASEIEGYTRSSNKAQILPIMVIGLLLVLGATFWLWPRQSAAGPVLPAQAAVARDYVAARDAWGRRTRSDLLRAVRLYNRVIDHDPTFAPARAGLAETWLLLREYGEVSEAQAFSAARIAAEAALRLDPNVASAHRALGMIQYWWDHDPAVAVRSFRRALALDASDGQTSFWFANVLADMGRDAEAERYYAIAMIALPGSQPIAVEHACAQWQAGRTRLALTLLTDLKRRYPDDPTVRDCLTWVHMSQGDIRSYAKEFAMLARLRGEVRLIKLSARLDRAVTVEPNLAHRVVIDNAMHELIAGTRRLRSVPAYFAASMDDRVQLIALLRDAARLGERWSWPALERQIDRKWGRDREVSRLFHMVDAPNLSLPSDTPE